MSVHVTELLKPFAIFLAKHKEMEGCSLLFHSTATQIWHDSFSAVKEHDVIFRTEGKQEGGKKIGRNIQTENALYAEWVDLV